MKEGRSFRCLLCNTQKATPPKGITVPRAPRKLPEKYPENVPGQWSVMDNCFACLACVDIAPQVFGLNFNNGGYAYVYRQPETPEDEAECRAAQKACDHHAIYYRKADPP